MTFVEVLSVLLKSMCTISDVTISEEAKEVTKAFDVTGYPKIYMVDGDNAYLFELSRNMDNFLEFGKGGYKEENPIDTPKLD